MFRPDEVRKIISVFTDKGWIDRIFRGHEIHAWLALHNDVESFVILDDNSDMEYLLPRLVKTEWSRGLTKADAKKAIGMLNESPSP